MLMERAMQGFGKMTYSTGKGKNNGLMAVNT